MKAKCFSGRINDSLILESKILQEYLDISARVRSFNSVNNIAAQGKFFWSFHNEKRSLV